MPLNLITGPPNSGRTGAILDGFRTAITRDPLLVVPTVDDAERFETELTAGGTPVLGATVCTFERLFGLVGRALGAPSGHPLSLVQRRRLAREAVSRSQLRLLAASAQRPGFATALEQLISELQAAAIDPPTLRARAEEQGSAYELELAQLYERFAEERQRLDHEDEHTLAASATAALRARRDAWGARPVFLYGFDDLTLEQLELVRALAEAAPVTIAVPYEEREVLTAARSSLLAELREFDRVRISALEADPANTESETLFALERRFGEPTGEREPIDNDGGLALLASAGERAEAEAVGAEVARLLDQDVPAGEIAVVLRDPSRAGPLYRRVFAGFGIPVAVQADLPATRTLTGVGLVALLEAALGAGRASDLLAYLRTPGIAAPAQVDWFERLLRRRRVRGAGEARERWHEGERRRLSEIDALRSAGADAPLLREAARQARRLAELALYRRGETADDDRALELRAGAQLERALGELAELDLPHSQADVIAAVRELQVPLWRGPTEGRVRVISPYRARARRVEHLFVASLQDGEFPRRDSGGPLLSDEGRAALGLGDRTDAELEDRYLFAICLSRPRRRLWLSWRSADDEGGATSRSRFVDGVRELLSPPLPDGPDERDEAIVAEAGGRGIAEAVFTPDEAPSETELARAVAARANANGDGEDNGELPLPDEITAGLEGRLRERIAAARGRLAPARLRPGPLSLPVVLEQMRTKELFGPSTIEEYAVCPYRWFVDHELSPQRIDPEAEALTAGQIAHKVLERLYGEQPNGERRPTRANLGAWRRRARELVAELGPGRLPAELPDTSAALHRVEGLVLAFIGDEARAEVPFLPDPELAEARFGFEGSEKPALRIGSGGIHGQIDRIDIGPRGEALIQDYKSGGKVDGGERMLERGKLQIQLYMLAAREVWGLDLAGGLYRPLGGTSDRRPKGLLRKELRDELAPVDPRPNDHLADERFEAALEDAGARAAEIIEAIQTGQIWRDPIGGRCPSWCDFQPICRRERGLPEEEPGPDADESVEENGRE